MKRISQLSNNMNPKGVKIVNDSLSWLNFNSFFTEEIEKYRVGLREILEKEVAPVLPEKYERAEYPDDFVPLLRKLELNEKYLSKPYGLGNNVRYIVAIILEMGRIDASLATMFLVQNVLCMNTIDDFGSDFQKQELLPKMKNWDLIGGWGLTEKNIGSDASNMETSFEKKNDGTYVINGNKRWIGNANKDIICLFAKDIKTKEVKGFIVNLHDPAVERKMIERKLALRMIHNMDLTFNNLVIEEKWRLPKVGNFGSVAKMLAHSRLYVAWVAVAIGIGIYDHVIQYINSRKQFNKSISQFQLIQEKLTRIMGNVQASLYFCAKLTELAERGELSIGKVALGKAWITSRIRESAALGREMLGGNGIILDNYLMKAFVDIEAIYTYEGTYDINSLVSGRELTGFPAFK